VLNNGAVTDLWSGYAPAIALKPPSHCKAQKNNPWPENSSCVYEDALFESEVQRVVQNHPLDKPLFLFWAPHIVHGPAQLPETAFEALSFIEDADGPSAKNRQNYLGRVKYIDSAFGRLVATLKARNMYANCLIGMSSDNGGPLGSANNYPLRGGKHSNWQGGVRVNAFLSGGFLPQAARGTVYNELMTAWDWMATFSAVAGVDPTDHRAAAAGLPPIDSINQWDRLVSKTDVAPRTFIPLGSCSDAPDKDAFCQSKGNQQTIVNGIVAYVGREGSARTLWKLLIGRIPLAGWTWQKYPNGTAANTPTISCGTPVLTMNGMGGVGGCLFNLTADPNEHNDLGHNVEHAEIIATLFTMLQKSNSTTFSPNRGTVDPSACLAAKNRYNNTWGPWIQ
jgi:arylsulfatase I/J